MQLIQNIEIKGFRGFKSLTVPKFGKVNLITGRNNAGKSSLLEAIRILVTHGSLNTLHEILDYRDETQKYEKKDRTGFEPYQCLFTGFPSPSAGGIGFSLRTAGEISSKLPSVTIKTGWATKQPDSEQVSYKVITEPGGDLVGEPVLAVTVGKLQRILPLDLLLNRGRPVLRFGPLEDMFESLPLKYLDPFSSRSTSQLAGLWDDIALTDVQEEVMKALQLISPDIQAVAMVGEGKARIARVRSSQFSSPVPLRTFGDGINRLFGIVLSLCNAKGGVLLIDEFENGLHYSVQPTIWNMVFRLANELDVQVFATSHSEDCVRAFQKAAEDSSEEGVLVRLTRRGEHVFSTEFDEDELGIATRNDIEVR